jgi:CheY-like chemotaxis protein
MPTWMVVEDEPDVYELIMALFEMWGIEGVAFVDGEEAIAWLHDVDNEYIQGELPDIAILDIRLPGVSGPEVGARLRQSKRLGNIALVLMTAYRLCPEEEAEIIGYTHADALLYKPLPSITELHNLLTTIITQHNVLATP